MKMFDQIKSLREEMEPMIEISSSQLKAVKDWDVGKEYTVVMKLKQVSKELEEEGEICSEFEVLSIKEQ